MPNDSLFKIEDVNTMIKIFAFGIQGRFESPQSCVNDCMKDISCDGEYIIRKYRGYTTYEQK